MVFILSAKLLPNQKHKALKLQVGRASEPSRFRASWLPDASRPRRDSRSVNNARGSPTPQRVKRLFTNLPPVLPWEGLRPLLRRLRVSRRGFNIAPFGRVLGHFFAFFSIFSLFLRILSQHRFFDRYFSSFC